MFHRSQFSIFFHGTRLNQQNKDFVHTYTLTSEEYAPGRRIPKKSDFFGEKHRKRPLGAEIAKRRFIRMCEIDLSFFKGPSY